MRPIDLSAWPRAEVFRFFSGMSNPFYSVTFTVDVTRLLAYVRAHDLSFYYALVGLCTRAVNSVENFRYTLRAGQLFLLEERQPSFTDLHKGAEQFHIVTMPCRGSLADFCREAGARSRAQQTFVSQEDETDALIYFSCLPWLHLTALTNERDLDPDDNIPRIAWGRYVTEGGRTTLGLSVEVNHRFVDGFHIGRFAQALEEAIEGLEA